MPQIVWEILRASQSILEATQSVLDPFRASQILSELLRGISEGLWASQSVLKMTKNNSHHIWDHAQEFWAKSDWQSRIYGRRSALVGKRNIFSLMSMLRNPIIIKPGYWKSQKITVTLSEPMPKSFEANWINGQGFTGDTQLYLVKWAFFWQHRGFSVP